MAFPFKSHKPFLRKHTEDEYLKLEQNFISLFIAVKSLSTHCHNRDDASQIYVNFSAMCTRVEQIISEYEEYEAGLGVANQTASGQQDDDDLPHNIGIICNDNERKIIVEALDHMATQLESININDEDAEQVRELSNSIRRVKK